MNRFRLFLEFARPVSSTTLHRFASAKRIATATRIALWTVALQLGLGLSPGPFADAPAFGPSAALAQADGPPAFILEFGIPGNGPGEFDGPRGIATDANCNVYVVDSGNHRVQVFDENGNYINQFGIMGSGPGELLNPIGIAVNPNNGEIYVVDTGNHRVSVWNSAFNHITDVGGFGTGNLRFNSPSHVEYVGGQLVVTDTGNSRYQRIDAVGNWFGSYGTFGTNPGEFQRPYGITVNPGPGGSQVCITDLQNTDWVQTWTLGGAYTGIIGSAGTGNGQFTGPRGIDAYFGNEFHVVEGSTSVDRIQRMEILAGAYRTQWGSTGFLPGEFSAPDDVAACECYIFVTDTDNHRVQRFDKICVSGRKYEDANQNSMPDVSESGLSGWTIELRDGAGGSVLETAITDAAGAYAFEGIAAGTYVINEVQQPGWYQTGPLSAVYNSTFLPGVTVDGLDFGNVQDDCFEPQVYTCNGGLGDGFDPSNNEPSTPSVTFLAALSGSCSSFLLDYDVPPMDQCFAETQDCWPESCLVVGAKLEFTLRAGEGEVGDDQISFWQGSSTIWSASISSLPGAGSTWFPGQTGSFSLDLSSLPPDLFGTTNVIAALQDGDLDILIQDNTAVDNLDLNVFVCCPIGGSICGAKFNDLDCDGVWDSGEPPIPGWPISLTYPNGNSNTVNTDQNGQFCFEALPPGTYDVVEGMLPGWVQTAPADVFYTFTLLNGQNESGAVFGNAKACADTSSFAATFGNPDGFSFPNEPTNPGPDLTPLFANCTFGGIYEYDYIPLNQCFGETMTGWPTTCTVTGAEVCLRMRSTTDPNGDPETDSIIFYQAGSPVWSMPLNNLAPDGSWDAGDDMTICLDLADLPPAPGTLVTNILSALHDGNLDLLIQDDTGVDYIDIELTYCCDCGSGTCCVLAPPSICAWWPGDGGGAAIDLISAPATGSFIDNTIYTSGFVGDAFLFDGMGDRVETASAAKLNPFQQFTLDAWIRADNLDAAGVETFIEKLDGASRGYWLYMQDGFLGYELRGSSASASNVSSSFVGDGNWHLIALTVEPGFVRLYVDGVKILEDTGFTFGNFANNRPFRIGGTTNGEDFAGAIDEVEYFRRSLTEAEIVSLWEAGSTGKCRDRVSVPGAIRATSGVAQVSTSATICNSTPGSITYEYAFSGLPAGGDCDVAGPTSFFPSATGTITVGAGSCVTISPILMTVPSGMSPGDEACYEFRAWNKDVGSGPCDLVATGTILKVRDRDPWDIQILAPVVGSEYSDSTSQEIEVSFRIQNLLDVPNVFDYDIAERHSESDIWPVLSIDGGEPGEVSGEQLQFMEGEIKVITRRVQFARCARRWVYPIVLSYDPQFEEGVFEVGAQTALSTRGGLRVPVASVGVIPGEALIETTSADEELPTLRHLDTLQAAPMPFRDRTKLSFSLERSADVRMAVHDASGRRVRTLIDTELSAGRHTIGWDGRNDRGQELTSGIYFVRLASGDRVLKAKLLLTK